MKKYVVLAIAVLSITMTGCKNDQEKAMDAQMELASARKVYIADCPNLDDKGQPDAFGKPNHTPKCEEEQKHIAGLQQKVLDAQRAASR